MAARLLDEDLQGPDLTDPAFARFLVGSKAPEAPALPPPVATAAPEPVTPDKIIPFMDSLRSRYHVGQHDEADQAALKEAQAADRAQTERNAMAQALGGAGRHAAALITHTPEQHAPDLPLPKNVAEFLQQKQLRESQMHMGLQSDANALHVLGAAGDITGKGLANAKATAEAPYAGPEAAAKLRSTEATAAQHEQQAKTGAAALTDTEAFRAALRNGDSTAADIVRHLATKWSGKDMSGASAAELHPLLPLLEKGWQAEQMAKAREKVAALAGGAVNLSPAALEQAAQTYLTTGQLPQLGMGRSGGAAKAKIANRAAEIDPKADLASNRAGYGANKASLQKLQTQADAVNAFERTAMANLDQFLETAKKVVDTGSPLFNLPARAFAEKVAGDPKMVQFNVARQVAVQEIGKVLSGPGGAAISDSARHEVEGLLHKDASLAQIHAAADILHRDMTNRRAALKAELDVIKNRTAGKATDEDGGTDKAADPLGVR